MKAELKFTAHRHTQITFRNISIFFFAGFWGNNTIRGGWALLYIDAYESYINSTGTGQMDKHVKGFLILDSVFAMWNGGKRHRKSHEEYEFM